MMMSFLNDEEIGRDAIQSISLARKSHSDQLDISVPFFNESVSDENTNEFQFFLFALLSIRTGDELVCKTTFTCFLLQSIKRSSVYFHQELSICTEGYDELLKKTSVLDHRIH